MKMWLWPIAKFWTFTPQGWLLAIAWNVCELLKIRMPYAEKAFGVIIGRKGKKVVRDGN
ncbi:hypothetical protein [Serratia fonticola]|uniref:hypothetical protein n=1 Tax=Serratia fonticola TaxID=47917 RepID=UPI0034C66A36